MPRFVPLDPKTVATLRAGGPDAYGMPAERAVSDGHGNPCRSCLHDIPEGAEMLIAAARPFPEPQPYAETGPVFLCAEDCVPWDGEGLPPIATSADYLLKGYRADHRIAYGTGAIVPAGEMLDRAAGILADPAIAFVDMRSARNNCWQARIVRD